MDHRATGTPSITRIRVNSSSLAAIGYSAELQILDAEFRSGEIYRFFMVPMSTYDELLQSASKGAYFNERLRGRFPFTKLKREGHSDLLAQLKQSIAQAKERPK